MSEFDPNIEKEQQEQEEKVPFTPAGFEKRTAAWMGIAYVLLIMFAVTFSIFTGKTLPGTFPLFLVPVAVAAIVVTLYRQIKGTARGGLPTTVVVVIVCVVAIALGLMMGVPALVEGVRAARVR